MKDKKLVVKFTVICETDTSMVEGDTSEDKLKNFKDEVELRLYNNLYHHCDINYEISCVKEKIESYD